MADLTTEQLSKKKRNHDELNQQPMTKFISASGTIWHLAKREEHIGVKSGLIIAVYYLNACSGKQLGGSFGQTERTVLPEGATLCKRC
jgi:hypothetical protein